MSGEGPQWPRGDKSPLKWLIGRRSPRRTGDEAKTAVDSAQGGNLSGFVSSRMHYVWFWSSRLKIRLSGKFRVENRIFS